MNTRIVNRLAITSILALALALPSTVLAADLEIREIMYDLDGTDSSREWLEIRNVSGATIDLADWHFYENDTNHRLTPDEEDGDLSLASGAYAVIAQDPDAFYDDHSEVSALVVDSAFTLSNDGETIALSTPEEEVVGEVPYDPADGADGNGLSLQRNQGEWIAADPTPGAVNATAETEVDDEADDDSSSNDLDMMDPREEISLGSDEVSIEAGEDQLAIAGLPVELSGSIEGASEHRLEDLEFSWSLGNGVTEGGQEITYTYDYPGEYLAAFRVDTDDGVYTDGLTVEVIEPNIRIAEVKTGDDPYIALENDTNHAIDLAGWQLAADRETFTFPQETIHLEDQRLIIPGSVSGLSGQRVTLLLPDETVVASSTPEESGSDQSDPANTSRRETTLTTQSAGPPAQSQPGNPPEEESSDSRPDSSDDADSASGTVAGTTTAASGSVSLADTFGSEAQAAAGSSQDQVDMFWQWAGMLILLLVITVGTAILLRRVSKSGDDPSVQAAKFDINELD